MKPTFADKAFVGAKTMHIVHVINNLMLGGAENLMSTLLPALQERGDKITLICLNDGVHPPFEAALHDAGIPIITLHRGSVYDLRMLFYLGKTLQQLNPDIVHAHLFPSTYYTSLASRFFVPKAKAIMTEHDTSNRRMANPFFKIPERLVYSGYKGVICISKGVQQALEQHMPGIHAVAIPNGISLSKYTTRPATLPDEKTRAQLARMTNNGKRTLLLSVGRLAIKKNQETLIRMMPFLPDSYCLVICGDGDRRPVLEQLIQENQVQDRVWLAGNQAQVPYFIHQAQLGLLSSTIEGFGLAAVEMMAGGLPVLCSNVAGLNDVCPTKELLLEPHDAQGYAQQVMAIMQDHAMYTRLQQQCMETATTYSLERMADAYHEYYLRLCR